MVNYIIIASKYLVAGLAGWLGWLAGWLAAGLAGWLGWLAGWAGWLAGWSVLRAAISNAPAEPGWLDVGNVGRCCVFVARPSQPIELIN